MENEETLTQKVINALKNIYDPEIPIDIYELGLIYAIDFEEREGKLICRIEMTLTAPGCPVADTLFEQVQNVRYLVDEIDETDVSLVFEPPWTPDRVSYEGKLELGLL